MKEKKDKKKLLPRIIPVEERYSVNRLYAGAVPQ